MIINCDVAEGIGNEEEIFPCIQWANLACGGHAGDEYTISNAMQLAKQFNVQIGLHPSYPDKENFGRKSMAISKEKLEQSLLQQLNFGVNLALKNGVEVKHIKPHGALYNDVAFDDSLINTFLNVIEQLNKSWIIVGLSESLMLQQAIKRGLKVSHEVFADRRYNANKTLVSRATVGAVITNEKDMLLQAQNFKQNKPIKTLQQTFINLPADTICLHGDGVNAVKFAKVLHKLMVYEK
ncbi:MAG: 5-oxoprolinase subunit PxpA [Chitinophagaceae bacterium]